MKLFEGNQKGILSGLCIALFLFIGLEMDPLSWKYIISAVALVIAIHSDK